VEIGQGVSFPSVQVPSITDACTRSYGQVKPNRPTAADQLSLTGRFGVCLGVVEAGEHTLAIVSI
jgi:hypothetical protein